MDLNLRAYRVDGPRRGSVVVFPGGGREHCSPREAEPIARWLNDVGLSAFVLDYRVVPHRHPAPLEDATRALRHVRLNAPAWDLDPDRIAVMGFSAGAHLAATLGTHFNDGDPHAEDPVERVSSRPDALVLCYPVITFGEFQHEGCLTRLLGENAPDALRESLSLENCVMPHTPPTFLWHTVEDASVPVENSLLFAAALRKHGVPFELHVFPEGEHGLALAPDRPGARQWLDLCNRWLARLGF